MAIGYVSLFKEYEISIEHSHFIRDNPSNGWEGKTYNGISVMNFTSDPILVAYRNGLVLRLEPRHPLYTRPNNKWERKEKQVPGIYLKEEFKLSCSERDRLAAEEIHRLNEDKPVGISVLENRDCVENIAELETSRHNPHGLVHCSSTRVITPEKLNQLPVIFYDRDTDLAFCTDVGLINKFGHPYSSRGQSLRLMDAGRRKTDICNINKRFTFSIEIVDNSGDIGDRWLRPFLSDSVYHIPAIRDNGLRDGIRIYLTEEKNLTVKKYRFPTAKTMSIEQFQEQFPHFKLFKKYQDAKHYDSNSELRDYQIKVKRLEQDKLESEASHNNTMLKLSLEKKLIEDKLLLIDEQSKARQIEFEESVRRKDELHQKEMLLKDEECARLKKQNDELHEQKKRHKQEEHEQNYAHSKEKNQHEHNTNKRKTLLDWIKAIPSVITNVLSLGKLLIGLAAI